MTFTIEQIEAAMLKLCFDEDIKHNLMSELIRPQWKPQVGEVIVKMVSGERNDYFKWAERSIMHDPPVATYRPLTPDEVPALKVAIDALNFAAQDITDYFPAGPTGPISRIEEALAKIKELTHE